MLGRGHRKRLKPRHDVLSNSLGSIAALTESNQCSQGVTCQYPPMLQYGVSWVGLEEQELGRACSRYWQGGPALLESTQQQKPTSVMGAEGRRGDGEALKVGPRTTIKLRRGCERGTPA